jgi:DNA polymerase III delta prime subunit
MIATAKQKNKSKMQINTRICGQDEAISQLEKCITSPQHIFLTGGPGTGKTKLIEDFLESYYKYHNLQAKDNILSLSSHKDRGIFTIRETLFDFVRQAALPRGIVRWIVIDDTDTFPEISQQAIRRPMEQYQHLTRFIFIGINRSDLIPALLSRCMMVQLYPIVVSYYGLDILKNNKVMWNFNEEDTKIIFDWIAAVTNSNISKFISQAALLSSIRDKMPLDSREDYIDVLSTPPLHFIIPLLTHFHEKNKVEIAKQVIYIWKHGFSFEDILDSFGKVIEFYPVFDYELLARIQEVVTDGWICYSKSQTSLPSLIWLFLQH